MVRRSGKTTRATTTSTYLNLDAADLRKMNRNDLAKVVSTISSAANKRIARMEKAGQPISDSVDKFSVAGKSKSELMKEFSRARNFMESKTKSLSGQAYLARETAKGIAERISGKTSGKAYETALSNVKNVLQNYSAKDAKSRTFWRAYERLKETNPQVADKRYKYRILEKGVQIMGKAPKIRVGKLHERMQKEWESIYTEGQENSADLEDVFTLQ